MKKKSKKWIIPAVCYLLAVFLYFGFCVFYLVRDTVNSEDGKLVRQQLWLEDFTLESIKQLATEDGKQSFVSTDADPQMHYLPATPFHATRIVFSAVPTNKPSGEISLYYTTQMGDDFSENRKMWAKQNSDGDWYFDLRGNKIAAFRLDPDTSGGVVWRVQRIVLNEKIPTIEYFIPSARTVFAILFFPLVVSAGIMEVVSAVTPYFARRRFDSRAQKR